MDERLVRMGVAKVAPAGEEGSEGDASAGCGGVSFVLVPAPSSVPPQELVLKSPLPDGITTTDPFSDLLEPYFQIQTGEVVDMELVQKQAAVSYQCTAYVCPHVSPATLRMAAEAGTVQRIAIATRDGDGDDSSDAYTIYMYFDESANFKGRPTNQRASQYAKQSKSCSAAAGGDDDIVICGDAFLVGIRESKPGSLELRELREEEWFVTPPQSLL